MPHAAAGGVGIAAPSDAASAVAEQDPLVLAAAVVGLLAVLVALWWGIRRLRRTPGERFVSHLADYEDVSILMHPNPDPDAMASALAVAEFAEEVGVDTSLQYPGQIRHQENRAFETVLDLDFDQIDTASDLLSENVVLVDHNEPRGFAGAEGVDPVAVVDHHPGDGTGSEFTDVRPDHGACASIFAEYFEQQDWDALSPEEAEAVNGDADRVLDSDTATGLLYGIQSDTKHLTKGCSAAEFAASAYLYDGIDEDRLDRIANPQVDAEVLDVKARAIDRRSVRNAFAVSDVGEVSNADAIPQAADELTRLEGVTAVVVMGQKGDTLHLSGRSRDDRVHMGKTLRAVVEEIPMANAGGHARMGGGQLSVEHMEGLGPGDGLDRQEFVDRLFDAMAGDI
ncbi:DHH family phosphoesterase [Halosimplex aquaticum]|uniref:DHH family phosphoesterase n=1 Tax=Halosimplex aquaticum TaxID=3026162 RepID=A0ABD5Y4U7_9EURY|nr:DHH family phosphoesterase [Halosimplex aquaticum]